MVVFKVSFPFLAPHQDKFQWLHNIAGSQVILELPNIILCKAVFCAQMFLDHVLYQFTQVASFRKSYRSSVKKSTLEIKMSHL